MFVHNCCLCTGIVIALTGCCIAPQMSFAEASKIISMMWNAMGADTKKVSYNMYMYMYVYTNCF